MFFRPIIGGRCKPGNLLAGVGLARHEPVIPGSRRFRAGPGRDIIPQVRVIWEVFGRFFLSHIYSETFVPCAGKGGRSSADGTSSGQRTA